MSSLGLVYRPVFSGVSRSARIGLDHPWQWLAKGWRDLQAAPVYSLTYGAGIVLLSIALTSVMILGHLTFLVPFLAAGFFLVAPLLAIGLYRMSANLERGQPLTRCQALDAFRRNQGQLGMLMGIQFLILQTWMLVSVVLVLMLYDDTFPTLDDLFPALFLSGEHTLILLAVTLLGALFAAGVFCISAITVPMLIDRRVDVLTAMRKSVEVVRENWAAMLLWSSLIVLIVGAGLVTFYLGLFVAVPLVGHATWHAYRDLVPSD
ncbi:DUF2189 domain-containing protein [Thiorhodococcus fuscus]|uniref:DUF2189 domain-containing protein n=1 Tax=Thiorhodococcus fuscus TaxID=527200 RepID=A0ABW4Y9G5_9GAMM